MCSSDLVLLIMTSFTDMDHICIRSMIMRKAHELDVSLSEKKSHIFCTTCSNGSMGGVTPFFGHLTYIGKQRHDQQKNEGSAEGYKR